MNMKEYFSTSWICKSACQVFHPAVSDHIDPSLGGNGGTYTPKSIEFDEWHKCPGVMSGACG